MKVPRSELPIPRPAGVIAGGLLVCLLVLPTFVSSQEFVEVRNKLPRGGNEQLFKTAMRIEKDLEIGKDGDDEGLPILARISGVAVDATGRIYVAEAAQNMILVYDRDGSFMGQIGRKGEGPGEFRWLEAVAVNGTELFAADRQNVSIFDSAGTFVSRFNHQLRDASIRGMVATTSGHVFLSSYQISDQKTIHKFSRDGTLLLSFCDSYAAGRDEDFRVEQTYAGGPIALDPEGRICYSQRTPYQIRKFLQSGQLNMIVDRENDFMVKPEVVRSGDTMSFPIPTGSYGFCVLSDGTMVNSIMVSRKQIEEDGLPGSFIDIFEPDGHLSGSIAIDPTSLLLARDSSDRLYFLEYGNPVTIVRYRLVR